MFFCRFLRKKLNKSRLVYFPSVFIDYARMKENELNDSLSFGLVIVQHFLCLMDDHAGTCLQLFDNGDVPLFLNCHNWYGNKFFLKQISLSYHFFCLQIARWHYLGTMAYYKSGSTIIAVTPKKPLNFLPHLYSICKAPLLKQFKIYQLKICNDIWNYVFILSLY